MSDHHPNPGLPPLDDERMWASVYNALLFLDKDKEIEWLRHVRRTVEQVERQYHSDVTSALKALLEDRPWCRILDARGLGLVLFFRHYLEEPPSDEEVAEALQQIEKESAA